jgi:hypothetical protein
MNALINWFVEGIGGVLIILVCAVCVVFFMETSMNVPATQ